MSCILQTRTSGGIGRLAPLVQEQSFFDRGIGCHRVGGALMTAGCRFDVCRPPNAPRRKFPQPAPWFGAQSSGGEPPRGLRGPAEHAPRRRVIFVAVSPVTGHCRRLGAQKSLDQTNIVGRQQRSSGSLRRESKGASSRLGVLPAFGGFPNFSTNRSDASASDSYRPATDSIARRASSLRIASAAFRASAARLRQYSGLRSGMAFSATPRATVRQVVLPPLGLLLLWIARRGCYWSCGSCTLPDRFGDQW
jgi:hypothetical protein